MYTRREFGRLAVGGLVLQAGRATGQGPAQPRIAYDVAGVPIGLQTYSFRGLPRPAGGDLVDPLDTPLDHFRTSRRSGSCS